MTAAERQRRFHELLDRSQPRWVGIARAYAQDAERDDLLQEIALQVWRSLEGFRGDASLDTWAYRVALNTALGWRRKAQTRVKRITPSDADVAELTGDRGSETEVARVLDRFLASLAEADRAVLLLHLDGVAPPEAAEIVGSTPGAYRTRLSRIRRRFEENHQPQEADR